MESEIETTSFDEKGWIEKTKNWSYENWQTILVILIVLIVGVSAYNYNQQGNSSNENQGPAAITDNDETEINGESNIEREENQEANQGENNEEITETDIENKDQAKAAEEDNKMEKNEDEEEDNSVISSSTDSGKVYTVYANRGEGITHLARRALNEYLQETEEEFKLTGEHKIYIEDYLQNKTGYESIEINHQETFSESLIEEAFLNAKQLTPESLDNLKKYIK